MAHRTSLGLACALSVSAPALAAAATYHVGPGQPYATIQDTLALLVPGDIVEVDGDATYPGDLWFRPEQSGTPAAPVTVRGIKKNGRRPIIAGVGTEQWHDIIVLFYANHFVFEGFEIVGDGDPAHFGLVHKADDVTLRDVVVHGVGSQGLLGTDSESGSLTLEASEFYGNGNGLYDHQIYMATDETMYPGSVFRLQYCYVHDGAGGNNVKSRAERNEIYFNWIEGAVYHELDLIGPDGQDPLLAQENSDVVGNVLIKTSEWRIARIGGDGTGNTAGRYRFVNNTMILGPLSDVAIGMQETVETLELHNNVILRSGASGGSVVNHAEPIGAVPILAGSHNFIASGITDIPSELTATVSGADAGFTDLAAFDLRPDAGSPLLDQGTDTTAIAVPAFPNPLLLPTFVPPARGLGTHGARPSDAAVDIGAFEFGSGTPPGPGGTGGSSPNPNGTPTGGDGGSAESGCSCHAVARAPASRTSWGLYALGALGLGLAVGRLRARRRVSSNDAARDRSLLLLHRPLRPSPRVRRQDA